MLALVFDFLQYLVATAIWGIFSRTKENQGVTADETFQAPHKINWPAMAFFWLKATTIIIGYVELLKYLFTKL